MWRRWFIFAKKNPNYKKIGIKKVQEGLKEN